MKILIADDCPTTRKVLQLNLREWGYDPVLTADGDAALEELCVKNAPRLVLLDWAMPKQDGPSVCRELRRQQVDHAYIYIIFLTARDTEEHLIEAMEAGADDFITKPVSPRELRQRIRAGQRIIELQDRLLRMNRKMKILATHDTLTGILNRGAIMDRLSQELDRAERKSRPVSFVMLDIDNFRSVNDSLGHLGGDEVLREAARRLAAAMRSYDQIGRFGGEEFAVILPETDVSQAALVAERLRNAVLGEPFQVEGQDVEISASAGVASAGSGEYNRTTLIGTADEALYRAKADGRNCSRVKLANSDIVDVAQFLTHVPA